MLMHPFKSSTVTGAARSPKRPRRALTSPFARAHTVSTEENQEDMTGKYLSSAWACLWKTSFSAVLLWELWLSIMTMKGSPGLRSSRAKSRAKKATTLAVLVWSEISQ